MVTKYHVHATLLPDGAVPSDLWIADGQISLQPIDSAEELSSGSVYALPGLVDAHAHLTIDNAGLKLAPGSSGLVEANRRAQLNAGVLLIRDAGGVNDAVLGLMHDDDSEALPRITAAGRFLAPAGGYMGFQQETASDRLVEAARAHVDAGAAWVKIIADFPRKSGANGAPLWNEGVLNYPMETMKSAVDAVHASGARVAAHALTREAIVASLDAGVDSIEHGAELDATLLERMAAQGIAWTPTLGVFLAIVADAESAGSPQFTSWCHNVEEQSRGIIARARSLGVTIMAGTDFLPAGAIAYEIAALQKQGDEPARALAAASTDARRFLGFPGIEDGAPADLVIYPADPRDTPAVLNTPDLVMLGGRIVRGP